MKSKQAMAPIFLMAVLLFQSASGLVGGYMLIRDPSGAALNIPRVWLEGSPFSSYTIPGIILFSVLGIFPLVTFFAMMKKRPWSWYASVLIGIALVVWIGVQILIIGYQARPPLQALYGGVGVIILLLTSKASVKEIRQRKNASSNRTFE